VRPKKRLPDAAIARLNAATAKAKSDLVERLADLWKSLNSYDNLPVSFGRYTPSKLLPIFFKYASKLFEIRAREYARLIARPEEILELLEEEVVQEVLARIVPGVELCTLQPGELTIGFDERIASFQFKADYRFGGIFRAHYKASCDWEQCIGDSWLRFRTSSQSILLDLKFWRVHPFQFALRSPSNRSQLSTTIEAGLKTLLTDWERKLWERYECASTGIPNGESTGTELQSITAHAQSGEPLTAVPDSAPSTRKRPGPRPDPERDNTIATVLNSVPNWKDDIHQLEAVLGKLDRLAVEMPGSWIRWDPPPTSWIEAADNFRAVRKVFDRVLARVAKRAATSAGIARN
jgi:hypothetical protein